MKKLLLVTLLLALAFTGAQAQYTGLSQAFNVVGNAVAAGAQPGLTVAGNQAGLYQVTYVASGTVSTCTVQIQDSSDNVSYTNRGAAQTCTSTGMFSFQATPTSWVRLNITAQTGSGNVTYTLVAVPNTPVSLQSPAGIVLNTPVIATITNTGTLTLPTNTGALATGYTCGASLAAAAACPNTALGTTAHIVYGTFLLSSNASAVTGVSPAFTGTTTWNCVANDITTRANPVQAIPVSSSAFTITNTTGASDLISVICAGN